MPNLDYAMHHNPNSPVGKVSDNKFEIPPTQFPVRSDAFYSPSSSLNDRTNQFAPNNKY